MHTAAATVTSFKTLPSFLERLNSDRHELALRVFMVIVLAHWVEHLLQGLQIYVLGGRSPRRVAPSGCSSHGSSSLKACTTATRWSCSSGSGRCAAASRAKSIVSGG